MCGGLVSPVDKMTIVLFTECLCQKIKFHRTLLPLWSVHVCAVLPGFLWLLGRLAWNNWKLFIQPSLLNGGRKLDYGDIIASLVPRADKNDTPNKTSFTASHWGKTPAVCYIWIESMDIKPSSSVYAPYLIHPCYCSYWSTEGGDNAQWNFRQQDGRDDTFNESYVTGNSVKISRICEFCVIMGIMVGLLGCCSSSTLASRANDYVKTLVTLGFWLHRSPCSLRCWTNNTLAARSLSPR